jgi:hypothetical protein
LRGNSCVESEPRLGENPARRSQNLFFSASGIGDN